jgi:hypothetical protein
MHISTPSLDPRIFFRPALPVTLKCHHIALEEHLARKGLLIAELAPSDEFFHAGTGDTKDALHLAYAENFGELSHTEKAHNT